MKPGVEPAETPKQTVMKILAMLPDNISFDELWKELVFEWQVQRGLKSRESAFCRKADPGAGEGDDS